MVTGWWKAALFLASYTCLVTAQTTAEFSGSGLNPGENNTVRVRNNIGFPDWFTE